MNPDGGFSGISEEKTIKKKLHKSVFFSSRTFIADFADLFTETLPIW